MVWFKVTSHNTDKIMVIIKAEGITDSIQKGKSMHMFIILKPSIMYLCMPIYLCKVH